MPRILKDGLGRKRKCPVSWTIGTYKLAEKRREAKQRWADELYNTVKRSNAIRSRVHVVRAEAKKKNTFEQRHVALKEAHRLYDKKIPITSIISRTGVTKSALYR